MINVSPSLKSGLRTLNILFVIGSILSLNGCGGGAAAGSPAGNPSTPPIVISATNVVPIIVGSSAFKDVNLPYVSLSLCAPNDASNCQTIDHVLVDTGSVGLRIFSSALNASLTLPQKSSATGSQIAECTHFADGYTWGPLKLADLKIGGESVSGMTIQVISDALFATVPTACANVGKRITTPQDFGANGVLGIGLFKQDCGLACSQSSANGVYFGCTTKACAGAALALSEQVQHPVSLFNINNNGVIVSLAKVNDGGAVSATGTLTFGIETQLNNASGSAIAPLNASISADPATGYITTTYQQKNYSASFIDTGSNGIFFQDSQIPVCASGFYCPTAPLSISALVTGTNGMSTAVNFSIENANALFANNSCYFAFSTLAGSASNSNTFDFGLPFFYGKNVHTVIEGKRTSRGIGPYFSW